MAGEHNLEQTWTRIETSLRSSYPDTVYQSWLSSLRPVRADSSTIYVFAPDHVREWVRRRFGVALSAAAASADASLKQLELVGTAPSTSDESAGPPPPQQLPFADPMRATCTFDTFVIGAQNRFAHAAALAVAEMPGQAYNPLLIHGPAGVGKTHLLHAIAIYAGVHMPTLRIHYSTLETFTNNFISALRSDQVESFKKTYRHTDMLLLDDAHFLDGKTRTAEEFFHTIDAAIAAGAQVVISSDRHPSAMPLLESRLRERLQAGLLVDLERPDFATRLAVLRKIAAVHPYFAQDGARDAAGILEHIANRVASNVRVLQGALTRLVAYASLTGTTITLPMADEVLNHLYEVPTQGSSAPRIDDIQSTVANALDVLLDDLVSARRSRRLVYARQLAMYLSRELTDLSLPAIAHRFGGRDHTTVLHAHRKIKAQLLTDHQTRELVQSLVSTLTSATQPTTHPA